MQDEFPPEIIEPLCGAIGHMVLSWASVEACLDYNTAIIFQAAGGKHLDDQIPQALGRKLKFLRRCFSRLPMLEPFADEAHLYFEEAKRLSNTRNLVVHGVASKYDNTNKCFQFTMFELVDGRTMHKANQLWVPVRKILDEAIDCQELSRRLINFTNRLLQAIMPQYEGNEIFR